MTEAPRAFRLFVYGTLRPSLAPAALADVVSTFRALGTARMRGRLYDLGPYTGAVRDDAVDGWVHGEIVESTAATPPLAWFDHYEDYDPAAPERSVFVREEQAIETEGGSRRCWVYVLARVPPGAALVASGRSEDVRR
jgi:gamma-glutamylcyclotransferase (GGCT)/AIG2-like uncharacterized protein YtfP